MVSASFGTATADQIGINRHSSVGQVGVWIGRGPSGEIDDGAVGPHPVLFVIVVDQPDPNSASAFRGFKVHRGEIGDEIVLGFVVDAGQMGAVLSTVLFGHFGPRRHRHELVASLCVLKQSPSFFTDANGSGNLADVRLVAVAVLGRPKGSLNVD